MSIKERARKLIHSKRMLTGIGVASFLESTIVPIPLEALLIPLMQKRRERLWLIATITTFGCLLGALVGYAIGYFAFDLARDFVMTHITTEQQFETFTNAMEQNGFWFIFSTGVTPVPLQIAMLTAGVSQYSLALYMAAVASSRIIRYFGLALLVYYFGDKTEELVRKYKWQTIIIAFVTIALIIGIRIWLDS